MPRCSILGGHDGFLDLEAARRENNGKCKPEATVGGKRGGTKGVAHSHLPTGQSAPLFFVNAALTHTTCQRAAALIHHTQKLCPQRYSAR